MNSIKTLIFIVLTCLFSSFGVTAQDFNVTYVPGQQYTSKPSISQRLQGTDEVVVLVPINQSKLDEYYYACIVNYFTRLGVPVRTCQVHFEKETKELGSTLAVWGSPTGYPSDFWIDVNTLVVTANYVSTFTSYIGEQAFGKIAITDIVNKFIWEFNFDMPNNEKKFDKVLKSLIASSYYKNNSARQINPHYKSNWTGEWKFKDYFNSNNYHPLEGVYDGDSYKVAVKQGNDGKFYLVYLSGKGNPKDWSVGDIKAILEPTAIPTVFKAKWYGRTKQTMDNTIIFKDGLMTTYDEDKEQEQFIKLYPALLSNQDANPTTWSGSGFALKKGYLVTNFHVIDGASSISIRGVKGDISKSYSATVVGSDKGNDLALLKITDSNFTGFGNIPYSISKSGTEVGEEIFVLGYPLTSTMGDEIKLTTGIVSSKTGFQGDVSLYQISAPIQQGNSGGPLFDKKGNVVGIVSAKHTGAENVGYAIKSSYLRNLIESCASASVIPTTNNVSTLSLTEKVKAEKNFVFFIECSSEKTSTNNSRQPQGNASRATTVYNNPSVHRCDDNGLKLLSVTTSPKATILELSSNNMMSNGQGYHQWYCISPEAYLQVNGIKYKLKSADRIALAPNVTYYSYANETKTFRLIFPALPTGTTSFDFIESPDSEWKLYGIKLQ